MTHWATKYIGKGWHPSGDGVNTFNCWTFVQLIQQTIFGRTMPDIEINAENQLAITRACMEEATQTHWTKVDVPADGDCVLLSRAQHPAHVGIWIRAEGQDGILHCMRPQGVVFQKPNTFQVTGWGKLAYYRWRDV